VEKWPLVRNLSFKNVRVQDVTELVAGTGVPEARPLDGLTLADISGTCSRGISLANMTNVNLSKIKVSGYNGALISAQNVKGSGLDLSSAQ
jgi:hypothetical protein